ncbi:hypothetical protein ACE6H2_006776 [Prunus campanulata]
MGSTSTTVIIEAPEEGTEEALKQDGSPNDAGKLHNELREKHFGSSGKGTEQAPKQDEAGKLHKEMAEKHLGSSGNRTEQETKQVNERRAIICENPVNATGGHHVGVFNCNNGAQGTRCDIQGNKIESKDSEFVGVFNCGNDS